MKKLNLVYPEKSDIKYKISRFPDGQQNIVIESGFTLNQVSILSRLNNWLDLELIVASVASLRDIGFEKIHLFVPYILGARSDRKFEVGGNNYLRDVLCPVINSLNLNSVTCVDPHSDVLEGCINRFKKNTNSDLVKWVLMHHSNDLTFISPDAGASKKIYDLLKNLGLNNEVVLCGKSRDTNGLVTKTIVPEIPKVRDLVIVDDICDGGYTFTNIASEIKNKGFTGKLYLIVTHGIFSKGLEELSSYFDGIYCTNSYSDNKSVKQLNLF